MEEHNLRINYHYCDMNPTSRVIFITKSISITLESVTFLLHIIADI